MIETPQLTQTTAQQAAIIRLQIPKSEIQHAMGAGLRELHAAVAAQGIASPGPWFTHHLQISPSGFDFEICLPVTKEVRAVGRVEAGQWPAMQVARTVYHGDLGGLGDAWGELNSWMKTNGHAAAPDLWECYLVGPDASQNPLAWRTQLNRPLLTAR